jgi:hypothetical protein
MRALRRWALTSEPGVLLDENRASSSEVASVVEDRPRARHVDTGPRSDTQVGPLTGPPIGGPYLGARGLLSMPSFFIR